ncbi:AAA family ATPase [Actinomadura sp. LD22]|uniref:DNA 3'-5' helicase n=1 Tax=Actinomadura physcomitrii TaxID=2650748 RepID=A0A6I4MJZ6_9ACTN|nr:UvrD-helicase domain-containing protein [Actinomadura physcomitrii]MWA06518.1 AAA family ATPase [Actinomadura physcomitrii]
MRGEATLRLLYQAEKEIQKLPRTIKGAIYEFQHKFRKNPDSPGLQFKRLQGDSRLFSARVTADYRALLLHVTDRDYVLVAVRHRKDVYEALDRYRYQINDVTGAIEFIDLVPAERSITTPPAPPPEPIRPPAPARAEPEPLFAAFTDEQLLDLGVAVPLLPLIRKITTEDELLGLVEYAPEHTGEVLLALYGGRTYEDVLEEITRPVTPDEEIDTEDYSAALSRPSTRVTTEDTDLQAVVDGEFAEWRVFLHPTQRKLVDRNYSGPARVSGGPGTGKTIVALHRVKHLVDRLPPGDDKPVLLTTFNKNLAADLRKRLLELGGSEVAARVDIVNIDRLATQIVTKVEPGGKRRWIDDNKALQEWRDLLAELNETTWDAEFLHAEWTQVILGHAINSRADYFRVRRAGRGRTIGRAQRAEIWKLVERFVMRLDEKNLWTYRQVAERAARLEIARAAKLRAYEQAKAEHGVNVHVEDDSVALLRHRYRHVVVDEAQDLSAAHWKMLRAMVPVGRNDLFIVGDSHQRIYDNYVSLGSLGINIRGRSSKLTLSYRTTHEILGSALALLGEESWDDLDDGKEDLNGYRSVLRGPRPIFRGARSWEEEQDLIAEHVSNRIDGPSSSIGICVPERGMVADIENRLGRAGIPAAAIGPDGPRVDDVVHVGTMHRFKGLEYQHMIIAGAAAGLVPQAYIRQYDGTDPVRYHRELQRARSLLFVAATRARDSLLVSWHGTPSPFLPASS